MRPRTPRAPWAPVVRFGRAFAACRRGGVATLFAVSVPAAMGALALAVDYSTLSLSHSRLQSVADTTALAASQELRLSSVSPDQLSTFARGFAQAQLRDAGFGDVSVNATTGDNRTTLEVTIAATPSLHFGVALGEPTVSVRAVARLLGGLPICVLALSPTDKGALNFDKDSRLSAPGCAIYSDSIAKDGIKSNTKAVVTAGFICSAGGAVKHAGGFVPEPLTDCPIVPDPLASRPAPPVGGCDATNLKITGGSRSLLPGTYCGGIAVSGGATVTLQSGVYVIKDGPLDIGGRGSLSGTNVGVYLTGNGAVLNFRADSSISLTAPKNGPLASLLFFEDRASAINRKHQIDSNDARQMLGTVYLSRGSFSVDANNPVADQSAYTVIVARKIEANAGPNLVLNTNYGASDIPVPLGLGPNGASVRLER